MSKSVRSESAAVSAQSRHWPIITALLGGTASMREAGEQYLPKWPNEESDSYRARLSVATLYPAFQRTVDVLASKPFSKPITLSEDVPARLVEWMEDCDLQGHNLHVFASQLLRDCVGYGVSGVLVDYPPAAGINTKADEQSAGVRPYFTRYAPGTVLGWRTERFAGSEVITQVRLLESVTEYVNDFEEKQVEQVRVLYRGSWQVWRKMDNKDEWFLFDEGTTTIKDIPFVFFYGIRKETGIGDAPLVELAYQNIEHWQSCSDQQTILHTSRVPILAIIGADHDTTITVGASSAVKLPIGSSMMFVEHSGAAIEAGRTSILDLEERMRQTGAELLVLKPGDVTATQVQSENEANRCALQRIVEDFEDALNTCLFYMAQWVNEQSSGTVKLFSDFGAANLAEASADLLLKTNLAGKLSDESYHSELKRRGIVAPESNWEDEKERLDSQGPSLGMMGETDPVISEPSPTATLKTIEQAPPDYTPILDAIKAIPMPEQPPQPDNAPIMGAIEQLSAQVEAISQKVDEPQEAEIDLTPIQQSIAALGAKIEAMESAEPDTTIDDQLKQLASQVAALSSKPDPVAPDLSAIMREVHQAIANIPKQAQPVMLIDPQTGAIKKQITLTYGADGKPSGAVVEQTGGAS